ncbi:hypothetical protein PACTADRAFT_43408 [Pachysolen tannophilus NRRL Y-2460]|uniref:Agmatinase n=1 Tax=Pachysolen tannophilus NRRL Y-2460 TaxID=669874 RepID=A0A1E4TT55_PACTA|nr:hypothetical protein PACTADRAFT_43408 [Pachysolen tannophilus NRRL Y-2460]
MSPFSIFFYLIFYLITVCLGSGSGNQAIIEELFIQEEIFEIPESYIDSIYGELINSVETRQLKARKLKNGELLAPIPILKEKVSGKSFFNDYRGLNEYPAQFYELSSENLKLNKIQLPQDDDVSDINGNYPLFGGIVSFGHFPTMSCFDPKSLQNERIDIAIVGAPFDTGVSYRPGARFGPNGIRQGSMRLGVGLSPVRGKRGSKLSSVDPYNSGLQIVDCGDVPMTPFDNRFALNQLYRAQRIIHKHDSLNSTFYEKPRIITLGGDHTVTLMNLRSAYEAFSKKPISALHFDSHIDTWDPKILGGGISNYAGLNHGTFLHYAAEAGYINKDSSMHIGIRAPYIDPSDAQHDEDCGFRLITSTDIDEIGVGGISKKIMDLVGTENPVYISLDIDVLDPAYAPGTGTAEIGGFTTRELIGILNGLEGINLIGADVVEVSPPFDTNSGLTSLAAAGVIDSFLGLMVLKDKE